jgi:hypothetical protein
MATLKKRTIIKDSQTEVVEPTSETEKRIKFLEQQLEKFIQREEESGTEINSDNYIKVMSLCPTILNLCTKSYGQGKAFKFTKFGEVKRILYGDLVDILEVNPTFAEAGLFFILDERVIRRHGLDDTYSRILDKSKIEEIFEGNNTDALNLYKSSNPRQQEVIRDMLVDKLRDDENFDLNLIAAISKYSKVDLQEKANDAREFAKIDEEERNKKKN